MPNALLHPRTIAEIDEEITANRRELRRRQSRIFRRLGAACDAGCWDEAWGAEPELAARERELFSQRGDAQAERDAATEGAFRAACRARRRAG